MTTATRLVGWISFSLIVMSIGNLGALEPPKNSEVSGPSRLQASPTKKGDEELQKLLKARYDEAVAEMDQLLKQSKDVRFSMMALSDAAPRLMQSALELTDQPEDRVKILSKHIDTLKLFEMQAQERIRGGVGMQSDLHKVRYHRLDAEIQLLRAKREADKVKGK